jgi:hypothetical protein
MHKKDGLSCKRQRTEGHYTKDFEITNYEKRIKHLMLRNLKFDAAQFEE